MEPDMEMMELTDLIQKISELDSTADAEKITVLKKALKLARSTSGSTGKTMFTKEEIHQLTNDEESDKLVNMSETQNIPQLLPQADAYLDAGFNVLLIGPHGTGKTQSILDLVKERGMKMKYYSCSTLDPYTDLVGVPVPQKDEDGTSYLKMVRPKEIDEAELIFFDEFNRADPKTLNAIFEIIQFRQINGEPLPNLKACWAAMNPPDEEYQVEDVDPALLDRFDVYIDVLPKPSIAYMAQFVTEPIAKALKVWWDDHQRSKRESYISPRRLLKIGLVFEATGNARSIKQALPPGGSYDINKLTQLLRAAKEGKKLDTTGLGDGAADFDFTPSGIRSRKRDIAKFMRDNPAALDTHKKVLDALATGVGGRRLALDYSEVLDSAVPNLLEGWFNKFDPAKQSQLRSGFTSLHSTNPAEAGKYKNLYKVIEKGAQAGFLPQI